MARQAVHRIAQTRNIGIAAHIDAGKTTVTERILFYSHVIHRMGTVDDGNTVTDFLAEERERGITIQSAAVGVLWRDARLNIIDTPGHVDFTAEVERCLRVLDGAVIVFCGHGGVEAQSETVWRQANRYGLARLVFVNKLDRAGANFDRVLDEIRGRLEARPVPLVFPNGTAEDLKGVVDLVEMVELRFDSSGKTDAVERMELEGALLDEAARRRSELVETVAGEDDELLALYVDGGEVTVQALRGAVRRATVAGRIQPVFCGAALRNVGVQTLMDGIVEYLPSPRDTRLTEGFVPGTEERTSRKNYPDQPFSAYIFKTLSDEHGDVSFMRVYSGEAKEGARVLNTRCDRREKLGHLYLPFAEERKRVKAVSAGDIVGAVGLKFSSTGDTLSDPDHPIEYEPITFPEPVISMAIEPRTNADRARLESVLARLTRNDPTFSTRYDEETGQQIIAGMGELQLEVRRHEIEAAGVGVRTGEPRVSYREGLRGVGEADGAVDGLVSGRQQYARVRLRVERHLGEEPGRVEFRQEAAPEEVPRTFVAAVEQSVRDAATGGVLRGDPMINVRATLLGGAFREEESSVQAFALASAQAFAEACRRAGLVLLEPVMSLEVVVPEDFLGPVLKDLQTRGAEVENMALREGLRVVSGRVPLSRMFEYASNLRGITQGRATVSMEPREFGEVSPQDYRRLVGE